MKIHVVVLLLFLGLQTIAANLFQRSAGVCECTKVWWHNGSGVKDIPLNAVYAGMDKNLGGNVYVGRTYYKNELVPGKIVHKNGLLYIPYGGKEIEQKNYEILTQTSPTRWLKISDDRIPAGAVLGGYNKDKNYNFYICRVLYAGYYVPGKLNENNLLCYYSIDKKERNSRDFQILVSL